MTIESELNAYRALNPAAQGQHPGHSMLSWVSPAHARWLSSYDGTLSAETLSQIPQDYVRDMYRNILMYGPNGDVVVRLVDHLNQGLFNYMHHDDEATQKFVHNFVERFQDAVISFTDEAVRLDTTLTVYLEKAIIKLEGKGIFRRRRRVLETILYVVGFAKTFPEGTEGYYLIEDSMQAVEDLLATSSVQEKA